jgi:hypothetical protein
MLMLVGVIAVVGIGAFVLHLTDKPRLSPTVSCFDAQAEPPLSITGACYNRTSQQVQIDMYRIATSFAFDQVLFTLEGTTSSSWTCGKGCGLCVLGSVGETKRYYSLIVSTPPTSLAVLADGCELSRASVSLC